MTGLLGTTVHAQTTADTGSPGVLGFVATFVLALAVIGLMLSLTRHLRRMAASPEPPDPDEAAPGDGVPDDAAGTAHGDAAPDDAAQDDTEPGHVVPGAPDGARGTS